jgi:hypothetical protein
MWKFGLVGFVIRQLPSESEFQPQPNNHCQEEWRDSEGLRRMTKAAIRMACIGEQYAALICGNNIILLKVSPSSFDSVEWRLSAEL